MWKRRGSSAHAQSPRQRECCAALGRDRRLTGSLQSPERRYHKAVLLSPQPDGLARQTKRRERAVGSFDRGSLRRVSVGHMLMAFYQAGYESYWHSAGFLWGSAPQR